MLLRSETIEGVEERGIITALLAPKWYREALNCHNTYAGTISSYTFTIMQTLFVQESFPPGEERYTRMPTLQNRRQGSPAAAALCNPLPGYGCFPRPFLGRFLKVLWKLTGSEPLCPFVPLTETHFYFLSQRIRPFLLSLQTCCVSSVTQCHA